jgi:hypothetical protein
VRSLVAATLILAAGPALAESPRWGSFQLKASGYRPSIDAEFKSGTGATPFQDIFGTSQSAMLEAQLARSLLVAPWGTFDLGVGGGYYSRSGKGLLPDLTPSGDTTTIRVIPLSISLTFRLDGFADLFPLVPYVRASLLHYQWWVTNGTGGTASVVGGSSGSGGTNGFGVGAGLAFLLDFLDPSLAREMDRDVGINHTYLFVEASKDKVKDFGSSRSWDLSNDSTVTWSGGILFVF